MHAKIKQAYTMSGIIKRNFKYLTVSTFVLLYISMVKSQLDYCSSVWAPYKKEIQELWKRYRKSY